MKFAARITAPGYQPFITFHNCPSADTQVSAEQHVRDAFRLASEVKVEISTDFDTRILQPLTPEAQAEFVERYLSSESAAQRPIAGFSASHK